jgi:hypothetical protein
VTCNASFFDVNGNLTDGCEAGDTQLAAQAFLPHVFAHETRNPGTGRKLFVVVECFVIIDRLMWQQATVCHISPSLRWSSNVWTAKVTI